MVTQPCKLCIRTAEYTLHILALFYNLLLCQYQLSGHIRSWLHRVPWLCNFLTYCSAARVMEWARSQRIWSQYFSGGTIQFLLKWISKIQQIQQIQQKPFSLFGGWPRTSPVANKEAQSEDWIYRWFTWRHFCSSSHEKDWARSPIDLSNALARVPVVDVCALLGLLKGAGSFHIHSKTMKELCTLAVLGVREQPNLAQNLITHRHW